MPELSLPTQKLISQYKIWYQSLQEKNKESTIHVDEVASKVAEFYEKIRTIVDWKEEHLMRRAAIIRKIKRRFLGWDFNKFPTKEEFAEPLVLELIRGGHFPNDKIPEKKITEVSEIINKYVFILRFTSKEKQLNRKKLQFINWLFEIAACEIEEALEPFRKETALIEYMFELMRERIKVNKSVFSVGDLTEEEKNIQIYIAVQQALFKLDSPIISYNLLKYKYVEWKENNNHEKISRLAKNIYKIWDEIEKYLSCPLGKKFYTICEKYDTPYLLLGDVLSQENPEELSKKLTSPEKLESLIKNAYYKRLKTLKKRLSRAALYSTISIFLTKILSLILLEIALFKITVGNFNPFVMVINILCPTLLMFLLVITIKSPSKKNVDLVVMETVKIVYKNKKIDTYEIKISKKRGLIMRLLIQLIYLIGATCVFGLIIYLGKLIKIPLISNIVNIIFFALIMATGLALRKRAQELTIEEKSTGFFGFLFDIFFLPVAATGQWLANKWKKYNAIAAFFNALIDMPFSIFVEFLEQWRNFLKEKKEEIH